MLALLYEAAGNIRLSVNSHMLISFYMTLFMFCQCCTSGYPLDIISVYDMNECMYVRQCKCPTYEDCMCHCVHLCMHLSLIVCEKRHGERGSQRGTEGEKEREEEEREHHAVILNKCTQCTTQIPTRWR